MLDVTKEVDWKSFNRIGIFIDSSNVFHIQPNMGWTVDFRLFINFFRKRCSLTKTLFYYCRAKENHDLIAMLGSVGYEVRKKIVKQYHDGHLKADMDVNLTIDAIRFMSLYDTIFLVSGDSDFAPLLEYLRSHGKKTIVLSYRDSLGGELLDHCDLFLHFGMLERHIKYRDL